MGIAPDFSVFYTSAKTLVEGNNPYTAQGLFTGVGYPVFSLIPFIPFTLLPYQISQTLFSLLSITSVLLSVILSLKIISWKPKTLVVTILFALTLFMFPVRFTLGMGQSNNIVLLFLLSGLYLFQLKKINLAGLVFGLAVVLKPITAFLLLYFLLKKKLSIVINAIFVVLILLGLSFSSYYIYYLNNVLPALFNLDGREIYYNQGIMGFVSRFTDDSQLRLYLNYFFSFSIFIVSIYYLRKIKDVATGFSLFLLMLVILDTLSWQHHFVFLIFPFIVSLKKIIESTPRTHEFIHHNSGAGLTHPAFLVRGKSKFYLSLLGLSYVLVAVNIKNPQNFSSPLVLSHVFLGSMILLYISLSINFRR